MLLIPNISLFLVNVLTTKVEVHNPKAYFQPFSEAIPSIGAGFLPLLSILILAMTLPSLTVFANPLIDVSLSDGQYLQVYDFLDRMAAKKVIFFLKNSRPYSRGEVATALAALNKKACLRAKRKVSSNDVRLSRIEQKRLAHLMRIFAVDLPALLAPQVSLPDYQYHDDEYLLQTKGETYRFGLSMEAGETMVQS